jgi:multidrug efflux pump subunit AcrA (membrane-fusion protein)
VQVRHRRRRARAKLDALPEATLDGTVTEIASAADRASGMFGIEVAIAGAEPAAEERTGREAHDRARLCPEAARACTCRSAQSSKALAAARACSCSTRIVRARATIEVAFIEGGIVALASGVDAGEQVITDGALYLEDGERVAIFKATSKAHEAAASARSARL